MLGATPLTTGAFVTVDIETTGCRPGTSGIIEIGAVRLESGSITDRFSALVRPPEPIPPAIQQLTGINDTMVAGAEDVGDVMARFREFVGDGVLVAHNHRFDMGFLDFEAERVWGTPFPRPVLDTLALARRLHPELDRHNLRALAQFYGADAVPNHRAFPDALATAEILRHMLDELASIGFQTAADAAGYCGLARQGGLARKLALATHLPDSPGIYLFRDAHDQVVYVGRAKNLRTRVRGHFYAPGDLSNAHPGATTASIDHITCVSPLDALLLESRLVNRYQPCHNRDQHRTKRPLYLHIDPTAEFGSLRVTQRRLRSGTLLGPVSNEWAAATVADAVRRHFGLRLCTRDLSRCATRACGPNASEACCAPCAGAVSAEEYRGRVDAALAVFNGGGPRFRAALQALRDAAVAEERYEQAIHYRDAVRALDRTMSALDIATRAADEPVTVLIEGDETAVAAHVLVCGALHKTLRFSRDQIADPAHVALLERCLTAASRRAGQGRAPSARKLRDTLIIDAYRHQHRPLAIGVGPDISRSAARVSAALRRIVRAPRKRHEAASGG